MTDEQDQPQDEHYEMVMPFVVVTSKGGPYDDAAFCAGYELGRIDAELQALAPLLSIPRGRPVTTETLPQLDLIAMRHGYVADTEPTEVDGWTQVTFRLAARAA